MAQYATPSELASYLQQDLDASTANLVLTLASGQFSARADTWWAATTATYTRVGTPSTTIDLPFRPVTAVSQVTINGVVITGYTLIKNTLYRAAGFGTPWASPPDVVVVSLTHGYTTVPDDVKAAVLDMAAQAYAAPVAAVTSESIDDYSVRYSAEGGGVKLTPFAERLAEDYRGTFAA